MLAKELGILLPLKKSREDLIFTKLATFLQNIISGEFFLFIWETLDIVQTKASNMRDKSGALRGHLKEVAGGP